MSFQAKLILDDLEFNILTADYAMSRPVDIHNRPNGRLRGGIIDLTIESGNDHQIINWIVNNQTRNGRIEFARRDTGGSAQKTVIFTNAFCIFKKDIFISDGSIPMITKITISANMLEIENNIIQNTWAGIESGTAGGGTGESTGQTVTATDNTVDF